MDISKISVKKIRELIVFTAFLVVALWKFDVVLDVLKAIWGIAFPFVLGGALAFMINVPMSFLERTIFKKAKKENKIVKKLSRPVLVMIHNEQKAGKVSALDLKDMGFISRFRVRQMLRELRTGFTVVFGMFIALLIMMLGIDCYVMCEHLNVENKQDTKYEYMYSYKYPTKEVPDRGIEGYAVTLKKEVLGYNLDVTLLGITDDNPYFDAKPESGKNKIIISSAMSEKYGLHTGDKVILTDEEEDVDYAFSVCGVTKYSLGMYAFMDIESMRELFDVSDDYYNMVFSDHALSIPSGRLYGTTSRAQIEKSSSVFISLMMPMVVMMVTLSAVIFAVVMYLMMKVMIDRSAFGISLMKIFGYRTK